ncbi:VOC family protein [Aurantibacillus circumpalustris]|uniref:VOC family protein n=1 Tax=Aurantibacillus circumpalustris TaxID=3036359 RepID=UPI00295B6C8F|nr:VOC family protein [Aurantibacillus circumpalustris]
MRQKLNLITLGVKDLQKSLHFYENGLGWKKSSASNENIAFFSLGGMVLSLYPRNLLADDVSIIDDVTGFSGITLAHNCKSEKEVEDVLSEVEKLGAIILKPAQKVFWGGYSGYFKDLDGHIFEVAFNPFWEFDENDNVKLP